MSREYERDRAREEGLDQLSAIVGILLASENLLVRSDVSDQWIVGGASFGYERLCESHLR